MGFLGLHLIQSPSKRASGKRVSRLIACSLAALLLPFGQVAVADIYRYTDDNGVIHFSNVGVSGTRKAGSVKVKSETVSKRSATRDSGTTSSIRKPAVTAAKRTVPEAYTEIISRACDRHGVDPALVQAIVKVESDFNPFALSSKGAMGLMQLMPQTAEEMNVRNTFNPHENIDGGVKYLRSLIDRYAGNLSLALAAYNSGETAVRKWGTIPPFPETQSYVKRILELYQGGGPVAAPADYTIYMSYGHDGVLLLTDNPYKNTGKSVKSGRSEL